jgi:hypothetical protein
MAPPTTLSLHRLISWPYTLYFLYLDPLFAIFGTLLIIFNPVKFLTSTSPLPLASSISIALSQPTIAPIIQLLLTNIAALYLLLAVNEALVLRASNEIKVWKAVLVSLVVADVGHLYAVWYVSSYSSLMTYFLCDLATYGRLVYNAGAIGAPLLF